jgi:hypothetical protein
MWVQSLQLMPSAKQVLHHSIVYVKAPKARLKSLPPEWRLSAWGPLVGYVPGSRPTVYEENTARFVAKGSVFEFSQHYTPNGVAVDDRTRIGLVLARTPPENVVIVRALENRDIFLPAGAADVSAVMTSEVEHRMFLRSLLPHMHLRGKRFLVEALLPDGTQKELLRLTGWDQSWQFTYAFREWEVLEKGTVLKATAWWDNSAANLDNPDPTADVRHGDQTTDEMFMLATECIVPKESLSRAPRRQRRARAGEPPAPEPAPDESGSRPAPAPPAKPVDR